MAEYRVRVFDGTAEKKRLGGALSPQKKRSARVLRLLAIGLATSPLPSRRARMPEESSQRPTWFVT